jgi:hypothetical protein
MAGISELTSPRAVEQAIAEYDRLGRTAFLAKYGFREARSYFLVRDGRHYDSKAIVGAAFGFQHPDRGPLAGRDFVGGQATVRQKLEGLGFTIVADGEVTAASVYTSHRLDEGGLYPREVLIERFSISDATVNTGVFRPSGTKSIWLFVTRDKTSDRTQYRDELTGDVLRWEGQTAGRTDRSIIEHENNGDELLLFFRVSKRQYPNAGFRYEGRFRYLGHTPGSPSRFTLQRLGSDALEELATEIIEPFDPTDLQDGRTKVLRMVAHRQGQATFRRELMRAHGGMCAVTGCAVEPLLEAAHIRPYLGPETNHVTNGLLLRADIHTLFDLGLLTIDGSGCVEVSPRLDGTEYAPLAGKALQATSSPNNQPSERALAWHRNLWLMLDGEQAI